MKTVVQNLIDKVDAMISNGGDADLLAVKVHLENSLEAEKEQMKAVYTSGFNNSEYDIEESFEQCYKRTFKSE